MKMSFDEKLGPTEARSSELDAAFTGGRTFNTMPEALSSFDEGVVEGTVLALRGLLARF